MSKIICDVCGTSFPETANQCPICGCVRAGDARVVAGDTNEPEAKANGTYTYVKGGRFSKSNVKKRNKSAHSTISDTGTQKSQHRDENEPSNTGLIVVVITLLLAIVAVVFYIATRFFAPSADQNTPGTNAVTPTGTTQSTEQTTAEPTVLDIPCMDIVASKTVIEFDKVGAAYLLNVTVDPVNTTDKVVFTSTDVAVATVTEDGNVVSVGPGEAVISISCGDMIAECRVVCNFEIEETTAPTEETQTPTYPTTDFKLKKTDITMGERGQLFVLYKGEIPAELITWTTDNEKVAVVTDGTVKAVGKGTTKVYAEYGGVKLECIVRCSDTVGAYVDNGATGDASQGNAATTGIKLNRTDVTLYLSKGESFTLRLLDENNNEIQVEWTVGNPAYCKITNGLVEGLSVGTTTISTTYEGITYKCIVRVTA